MIVIKISGLRVSATAQLRAMRKNITAELESIGDLALKLRGGYKREMCYYCPMELPAALESDSLLFVEVIIFNPTACPECVKRKVESAIDEGIRATFANAVVRCAVTTHIPGPRFWDAHRPPF